MNQQAQVTGSIYRLLQAIRIGFIAALVLAGSVAPSQTITGSINGTVTDPSGAVVPNAKVTATNVNTGVVTTTTTNNDGLYNIRFLQIGSYKVTVESAGFASAALGPFVLETGQNAKIDAKLVLASQTQNVQVEASVAPLLNTENPTLATTLDTRAIENVPLVSRNIIALTMFLPGAISTNPNGFVNQAAVSGPISANQTVSINGNRQQANQYLLDGMNINQTLDDIPGYSPSVDAIGQVQVISANAPAEYGNVLGGDVLYQTKSGTNQFHGSAFYFLTNYLLNANTWANKHGSTIIPRNSFTRNIFGGTIGGPLLHDRLFFFGDYQGGRYHSGGITTATVLTQKERTGDFSELLDPSLMCSGDQGLTAGNYVLINGIKCKSDSRLIQLYDATQAGAPAYANNKIPITNPAAIYLLSHPEIYPLPNRAPDASNTPATHNYQGPTKTRNYGDQFDIRVDWKASDKDSLSVRFTKADSGQTNRNPLLTSFTSAPTFPVRGVAINEIHTFNASLVNEFRAGYTRIQNNGAVLLDPSGVFGLNGNKILGISSNSPSGQTQAFAGFAVMGFGNSNSPQGFTASNGTEYTNLGNANLGTNYTLNTFLYGDNFTWLKNRHTFKFGVQFMRQQQNNFYPGNDGSLGGFYFLGAGTASPTANPNGYSNTGYAASDFLLDRAGFVSKGGVAGPVGMRSWRDAYFIQDDWRMLDNLTVNIGVRYEYVQPIYEVNNKMSTIDPDNPAVILLAGTPQARAAGYGRALVDPFYGSVMPRIGFAWSATPRWVLRGGYGLQNFMEGTGANLRMTTNLPFQSTYQASGVQATTTNVGSFFKIEDGFSNPASGAKPSGGVYNVWNKHIKPEFIGMYSMTLEYQLSNTASVQAGYIGETGQHLVTANQRNQLHNPCIIGGIVQSAATPNPSATCLAQAPAPFYTTPGVGYNGVIRYTDSNAVMNYNGLQTTFRQRPWKGLQYTVNYTWSHAMTNSVGFYGVPSVTVSSAYAENVYNMHNEYGPAGQDVRHAINWNMVYDLPVGRGRMFGSAMPLILDEIVGGWRLGMTGVSYTGFPVNINTSSNNSGVNGNSQRANHYRKLKIVHRSATNWFGTDPSATPCTTPGVDNGVCAYGQPAAGTFGTSRPTPERAPGFQSYGASVTKDFTVWHENQINFRVDADNLFNSAYLGNPVGNVQSNSFGNIAGQTTPVRSGPRQLQLSMKYHF
ncbi:TonB-dependent receptor [Edaphobacter sp.]|uniref:TonB-dependent receptor n=1 Tax=Edaphobacter sp. TaxID=1934404 RepID=UPI002DBFB13A|nr:carboxypeptidase regulatory-like domain-containing protein [Edaphobacter sp.]HEU5342025.1 carboxypeptidase regulatory-like domain-containing protein [Edaphobacter sp.]